MKKASSFLLALILFINLTLVPVYSVSESTLRETVDSSEIRDIIMRSRTGELAPAVSVAVTNGTEACFYSEGLSDVKNGISATENTVYEIGSVTKAFTALAMLILEDEGKVSLDENVSEYLPWFAVTYNGKPVEITLKQLIYHQSGLPNNTMNRFMSGTSNELKEKTARLAQNIELDFAPGTSFEYCNLGYAILGYIIETVSGQSYEDYVTQKILIPLGMTNSGFNLTSDNCAKGYSQFFGRAVEYDAPKYQGNLPEGYLMTSAEDMSLWMNAQLGKGNVPENLARLIDRSHTVERDNTVTVGGDEANGYNYYTYGWEVNSDGTFLSHSGLNPNFTSLLLISKRKGVAGFVVSNIAGEQASNIGNAIMCCFLGKDCQEIPPYCAAIDKASSIASSAISVTVVISIIMLFTQKKRLRGKKKHDIHSEKKSLSIKLVILGILLIVTALIPYLTGYTYGMLLVWMPKTLFLCIVAAVILLMMLIKLSISHYEINRRER